MRKLFLMSFVICTVSVMAHPLHAQRDRLASSMRLGSAERVELNESLPQRVRNFLETADEFVIFAQLRADEDGKLVAQMDEKLVPNFKAIVSNTDQRNALLRAFYAEASKGHQPAICYSPSHSIVAHKGGQKVVVEICFGCRRFYVSGSLGESEGTLAMEPRGTTERLVTNLITELGVTTK